MVIQLKKLKENALLPTRGSEHAAGYDTRILLHLENNRVVPPSSQDVALCRYSVSGEVPLEELEFETVLVTLDATHKVPRHPGLPREEHRSFPATLPLSPFSPPCPTSGSGAWASPRRRPASPP